MPKASAELHEKKVDCLLNWRCSYAAWDCDEHGDAVLIALLSNHFDGDLEAMLSVLHGHVRKTKLKAMRKFARSRQATTSTDDVAVNLQAEQQDDAIDVGTEDLQHSGDATRCASCNMLFESGEEPEMINGRPYHADVCTKFLKPIASAA